MLICSVNLFFDLSLLFTDLVSQGLKMEAERPSVELHSVKDLKTHVEYNSFNFPFRLLEIYHFTLDLQSVGTTPLYVR